MGRHTRLYFLITVLRLNTRLGFYSFPAYMPTAHATSLRQPCNAQVILYWCVFEVPRMIYQSTL